MEESENTQSVNDGPRPKNILESIRRPKLSFPAWPHKISRLTAAGHLVKNCIVASNSIWLSVSNQIWSGTLQKDESCEAILAFSQNTSESMINWFYQEFRKRIPQLIIRTKYHKYSKCWCLYISANIEDLLEGAEELRIKKWLKKEYGGGLKEFNKDELDLYQGSECIDEFLTSSERQSIICYFVYKFKSKEGDSERIGIDFYLDQSIIPICLSNGVISQFFPLHDLEKLSELRHSWVQAIFKPQPLEDICTYFGVKIAVYFAWLGHYTKSLVFPAFFGLCSLYVPGFYSSSHNEKGFSFSEDATFISFALFNILWASIYLETWKRKCAELAHRWGTLDAENDLLTPPRPLFCGPPSISPITGLNEPSYSRYKRNIFRYLVSLPCIFASLLVVVATMFALLELQEFWDEWLDQSQSFNFWCFKLLPKILMAIVISVFDVAYGKLAYWLNDMENYRLEEEYENHLIVKIASFQFVNSFLSLFYIAFYLRDMDRLREQLATLLITRQILGNVKESILPFCYETLKLSFLCTSPWAWPFLNDKEKLPKTDNLETINEDIKEENVDSNSDKEKKDNSKVPDKFSQAEVEGTLFKYDGTFEDYLEMFIQFGYVALFSPAFPLASFFALLNNFVEIRSDAFKLCVISQRPFGQPARNIGAWQSAMEAMAVIAVMVNCALIGLSGHLEKVFPQMTVTETILWMVVLEHALLISKLALSRAIPDIPYWVNYEIAKVEFRRREASKMLHHSELLNKKKLNKL